MTAEICCKRVISFFFPFCCTTFSYVLETLVLSPSVDNNPGNGLATKNAEITLNICISKIHILVITCNVCI
jgi:hypothetical protein